MIQKIYLEKIHYPGVSSDSSDAPWLPAAIRAFLIDLDGVLYTGNNPYPGVKECLQRMNELGYGYRFVSNSTRRARDSVAARLQVLGYDVSAEQIYTPPLAAIEHIKKSGKDRCFLLTTGDVHRDFEQAGICISDEEVDYVVMGDAGDGFTFDRLNQALRFILDGADILALEMDRYWNEPQGLVLSTGPFVAALEYATGKKALLMGKPSRNFFELALHDLGIKPEEAAMIGDDILTDVHGAQEMGMHGILVKTGKYREEIAKRSGVKPNMILQSMADLAEHL
ncbi:MAG: putative HAD-hydrolase [Methanosaeta sp. PtaU1.Bin112]|nr:MAG: putative HAD-hydrolase [Methanosaeta sp. PtaU1.Bin112]